jgi:hypothetical protein
MASKCSKDASNVCSSRNGDHLGPEKLGHLPKRQFIKMDQLIPV